MRIHGILLRDFRGVDSVGVDFDVDGVTIIEGRNESGKSTIADAFDLLLTTKDSSKAQPVQDAKPVGRDVGPFVEADLSVGPYRMTYRKQWIKDKKTELHIFAPLTEQITGSAAHDRVVEILAAETDMSLFKALRYHQGTEITQAEVGDSPTLAAALDVAAGGTGSGGGDRTDALVGKVEAERLKYVTPGGQPTSDRKKKAEQLDALRTKLLDAEDRLQELDEAVERYRQVANELAELRSDEVALEDRIKEEKIDVQAVETVERRVETARLEMKGAKSTVDAAAVALAARESLVKAADQAAHGYRTLDEEISSAAPGLEAATAAAKEAKEAHGRAQAELEAADKAAADARKLVELLDLRLERDQLKERNERVVVASKTIDEAEAFLARCTVDDPLLQRIIKATEKVAVARAHAEAEKPRLMVEALGEAVHVEFDGEGVDVKKGSPLEQAVSAELSVVINDLARVTVSRQRAGGDADEELKEALEEQAALLQAANASSVDEASELVRERAKREDARENAVKRRDDDLRDLDPTALAAKVERAEQRLKQLESEHATEWVGGLTLDEARKALGVVEIDMTPAKENNANCQAALEGADNKLRGLEDSNIEQKTRLAAAQQEVERLARELGEQRQSGADAHLAEDLVKASEESASLVEAFAAAERDLEDGDPDSARARLKNSVELRDDLAKRIYDRDRESIVITTNLEAGGREGLADRYAESLAELEELQQSVDAENRRADAVDRLYTVLTEKREKAQQAYVRPFREKLDGYCRILYGRDAKVEVDHSTLEIVTLIRRGTPIPFESLSGGVREQLAVLARLACAALVSPASDGDDHRGVPVIIDDALGYSDPGHLEQLGAAISLAGDDCQVIVLTCEPGRYRGVGGAKRVSLDEAVASASGDEVARAS
jgi:DNA repair exonuclease SbcCD ATPase subunit